MRAREVVSAGLVAGCAFVLSVSAARGQDSPDSLARTPPMGWNSWNKFACDVSEKLIRDAAQTIVASGMRDAGYQYVVIDDCWQVARDARGRIVADPERFPSGMKALADYVHSLGLKFGLYSDAGTGTCQKRPGSKGFEELDARQYAEWGIDYLKYDWCNTDGQETRESYAKMSRALRASGRPIVFSICEWGSTKPWLWAPGIGHLWRATGDIQDCWDCRRDWGGMGFVHILDLVENLHPYAGPGHWNDPDMLEVGNGGLTTAESRAHFSLWCLLAAPLMAGNDLKAMSDETKAILTNPEVIAVDQDSLGMQGRKVSDQGDLEVWFKPLARGDKAVVLFNRGASAADMRVSWEEIGLSAKLPATVRDLWAKKDLGPYSGGFSTSVPAHDVVMVRISQ